MRTSAKSSIAGPIGGVSTPTSSRKKANLSSGTSTGSTSSRKPHESKKVGRNRQTKTLVLRDKQSKGVAVRKLPDPARVPQPVRRGTKVVEQNKKVGTKQQGLTQDLTFFSTWCPAYLFKDMARGGRSFLLHVEKAVEIALGKQPDKLPEMLIDPPPGEAKKIFKTWAKHGWAVDVETPSLTEFRLLSVAACGSPNLAMVWTDPRKMGPLRAALKSPARKIVQNGDFDIGVFQNCGFACDPETFWDTMIEGAILHPDEPVNLSFLASMACDTHAWKFHREGDLYVYNGIDAWTTWMIYLSNQRGYESD